MQLKNTPFSLFTFILKPKKVYITISLKTEKQKIPFNYQTFVCPKMKS